MVNFELDFTISSPGESIAFMEFSPDCRFLAVGNRSPSFIFILDKLARFHPTISAATPAEPTALVWESSKLFYVGMNDGRFIHYQINLGEKQLVRGVVNNHFHGKFPITAMALDVESKMLVLSVGPDVFAFRRIRGTSMFYSLLVLWNILTLLAQDEFCFITRVSALFNFTKDPGNAAPPFPRSISFSLDNHLVITFCRWNIV
jgi:hypothetical protein